MNNKLLTGKNGEDFAQVFLIRNGYKIIERNHWKPWGELDIIARDKQGVLVIIEVKTMVVGDGGDWLKPEDNLTKAKLQKVRRTALLYAGSRQDLVNNKKGSRIDLISVSLSNTLTDMSNGVDITHWENVG